MNASSSSTCVSAFASPLHDENKQSASECVAASLADHADSDHYYRVPIFRTDSITSESSLRGHSGGEMKHAKPIQRVSALATCFIPGAIYHVAATSSNEY
jgi:hypothetical protein